MARDAVARFRFNGGHITDMVLERGWPHHPDNALRWYAYVAAGAEADEGMVEYDTTGRLLRVWRSPAGSEADGGSVTKYNGGDL
jgi:hypothetical protein